MRSSLPVSNSFCNGTLQIETNGHIPGWNVFIDVVLACLPITIFYNLTLNLQKKLGLSLLLGLGLVAAICGIIKTKFLASLNARSDLTCRRSLPRPRTLNFTR
jgi:hypothetical protein